MKYTLILITLLFSINLLHAQSTSELEADLRNASSSKERLRIKYKLAEAYIKVDLQKAARNAQDAADIARKLRDKGMQAKVAYIDGYIHEKRRQRDKAEARYKSALSFAKAAKNNTIIINSLDKLSAIEYKNKDYRQAYNYSKDALAYVKKNGSGSDSGSSTSSNSSSNSSSSASSREKKLEADNRKLAKEKQALREEIASLKGIKLDPGVSQEELDRIERELAKERAKTKRELENREEALSSLEEAKEAAEARTKRREKRIDQLSKESLAQELLLKEKETEIVAAEREKERIDNFNKLLMLGAGFAALLVLLFLARLRANRRAKRVLEEKNKTIEQERQRSDELLLNILPKPIAEELKENGKAKARKYDSVSVLFTDFKNFSGIAEKLSPETLVAELDHCFKAFDYIISQYTGLEKIKTIGDAYMCASGLTDRRKLPNDLVNAALEMQSFLKDYKQDRQRKGLPFFEARIGIHTGPVVAGVVGFNKFAYDIWGDTVNVASRMESNSEVGRVNISESTYNQIKYKFDCSPRGKIAAKNIGMIDMYYVNKVK